jgi:hypothetical protein
MLSGMTNYATGWVMALSELSVCESCPGSSAVITGRPHSTMARWEHLRVHHQVPDMALCGYGSDNWAAADKTGLNPELLPYLPARVPQDRRDLVSFKISTVTVHDAVTTASIPQSNLHASVRGTYQAQHFHEINSFLRSSVFQLLNNFSKCYRKRRFLSVFKWSSPVAPILIPHTPWPGSANDLYRPSDRRLSAKLVSPSADTGVAWSARRIPYGRVLGFLDRKAIPVTGRGGL